MINHLHDYTWPAEMVLLEITAFTLSLVFSYRTNICFLIVLADVSCFFLLWIGSQLYSSDFRLSPVPTPLDLKGRSLSAGQVPTVGCVGWGRWFHSLIGNQADFTFSGLGTKSRELTLSYVPSSIFAFYFETGSHCVANIPRRTQNINLWNPLASAPEGWVLMNAIPCLALTHFNKNKQCKQGNMIHNIHKVLLFYRNIQHSNLEWRNTNYFIQGHWKIQFRVKHLLSGQGLPDW